MVLGVTRTVFTNIRSRTVHEHCSRTPLPNRSRTHVHELFTNRSRTRVHEHCSRTVHEQFTNRSRTVHEHAFTNTVHEPFTNTVPRHPRWVEAGGGVGGGWRLVETGGGWWRLEAGGGWWRRGSFCIALLRSPFRRSRTVHEPFMNRSRTPFTNTVHEHCSRTVHELFTNTCSRTRVHEQLEHVHHGRSRTRCQNAFTNRSRTTVHEHVVHEHPNIVQVSPRSVLEGFCFQAAGGE